MSILFESHWILIDLRKIAIFILLIKENGKVEYPIDFQINYFFRKEGINPFKTENAVELAPLLRVYSGRQNEPVIY